MTYPLSYETSKHLLQVWTSFPRVFYSGSPFQNWFRKANLQDIIDAEKILKVTIEAFDSNALPDLPRVLLSDGTPLLR